MASKENFESTFSQVAEKHLRDNAPFLMDYAIGFEIKDRDEDGTSGFGVYAFRIGSVPAFIPVIYREGTVSGFELLWLSDHKLMVPSVANWVNTVKYQGQGLFGTVLSRNDVRARSVATPEGVHMDSSTFPYAIKTASEDGGIVGPDVIKGMIKGTRKDARVGGLLFDVLENSPAAVTCICKTALEDPDFADAWQRMYGASGRLNDIVLRTKKRIEKQADEEAVTPARAKGVKIITDTDDPDVAALSSSQKRQLMKHGSYILDTRDNHTTVFNRKLASDMLMNPKGTGYCRVLQSDGTMKEAWVGKLKLEDKDRTGDNPSGTKALVVLKDKPGKGAVVGFNSVYTNDAEPSDEFELGAKASKSSVVSRLKPPKGGDDMAVEAPDEEYVEGHALVGQGSPIVVKKWQTSREGKDGLRVQLSRIPNTQMRTYETWPDQDLRVSFDNSDDIRVSPTCLNIGENARVIDVVRSDDYFIPGDPEDFNEDLVKQAGLTPLELKSDGFAVSVRVGDEYHHPVNKEKATRSLVMDYGLDPGSARDVIKTACEEGPCEYLLKMAAFRALDTDPDVHAAVEEKPTITVIRGAQEAGSLLQETRDTAVKAAEAGNEDLFETTTLMGILNEADDGTLKKQGFLKLMRGMDETGRELFRTYYSWNDRVEQFGKQDVEKLRDSLKKNFKSMGDLVLFLQDKAASAHGPLENTMDGLLSENVASFE